eukprot:3571250-Rhodomonas_salina.1
MVQDTVVRTYAMMGFPTVNRWGRLESVRALLGARDSCSETCSIRAFHVSRSLSRPFSPSFEL